MNRHVINIKTAKGVLQVENRVKEEDMIYIHAPEPAYPVCGFDHEEISGALSLSRENLDENKLPAIVNAGMNTLLVCLKGLKDCLNCSPDYLRLREFALANDIEVITIYTFETTDPGRDLRTRVFAPAFGYLEDPATGSGNAALGYHLMKTGEWPGNSMVIEQGPELENPNIIKLGKTGSGRVKIGGRGVARIEGDYILI
jgi:PhzF family phenazine biosynthesis protein